jgi:hypothetical protein
MLDRLVCHAYILESLIVADKAPIFAWLYPALYGMEQLVAHGFAFAALCIALGCSVSESLIRD